MVTLDPDAIQSAIGQLEHALHAHQAWFDRLARTLICHLPQDQRDIRQNAHHECPFGQWYYNQAEPGLQNHAGFKAIEQEHAMMHQLARDLLLEAATNRNTPALVYDRFENSVQRLRLQITSLQRELQDSLLNLDPLTGVYNRVGMLPWLREQHELTQRKAQVCTIAMVDLDHFKGINDKHGHKTGDLVLKGVAKHLLTYTRPYDRLFRYGGEEFLLCLPQTDLGAALALAERLRTGVSALELDMAIPERLTASFGVAPVDPGIFVEESVDRADQALYQAKLRGRNRVEAWAGE